MLSSHKISEAMKKGIQQGLQECEEKKYTLCSCKQPLQLRSEAFCDRCHRPIYIEGREDRNTPKYYDSEEDRIGRILIAACLIILAISLTALLFVDKVFK